jgi:hypothetical protein
LQFTGCRKVEQQSVRSVASVPVRITQFYTNSPILPKGEKALVCYGVEGARKVSIDPPVAELVPSLTRCFEVAPEKDTTYTLTAEDAFGGKTSQSLTITRGGPAPKIKFLWVESLKVKRGLPVRWCYSAENAKAVQAGPGQFEKGATPNKGCLTHRPNQTTVYEVTVTGTGDREDTGQVTVQVEGA